MTSEDPTASPPSTTSLVVAFRAPQGFNTDLEKAVNTSGLRRSEFLLAAVREKINSVQRPSEALEAPQTSSVRTFVGDMIFREERHLLNAWGMQNLQSTPDETLSVCCARWAWQDDDGLLIYPSWKQLFLEAVREVRRLSSRRLRFLLIDPPAKGNTPSSRFEKEISRLAGNLAPGGGQVEIRRISISSLYRPGNGSDQLYRTFSLYPGIGAMVTTETSYGLPYVAGVFRSAADFGDLLLRFEQCWIDASVQ